MRYFPITFIRTKATLKEVLHKLTFSAISLNARCKGSQKVFEASTEVGGNFSLSSWNEQNARKRKTVNENRGLKIINGADD